MPLVVDQPRRPTERPFARQANHELVFVVKGGVERVFARVLTRWYRPEGTHVRHSPGQSGPHTRAMRSAQLLPDCPKGDALMSETTTLTARQREVLVIIEQ
ncbi:MAG TPA: hypothetical protein VJM75_04200, partial [Acidimicrobiales bacterium]|nr:hypothetical protein [Acidimicrobiales bacterium]